MIGMDACNVYVRVCVWWPYARTTSASRQTGLEYLPPFSFSGSQFVAIHFIADAIADLQILAIKELFCMCFCCSYYIDGQQKQNNYRMIYVLIHIIVDARRSVYFSMKCKSTEAHELAQTNGPTFSYWRLSNAHMWTNQEWWFVRATYDPRLCFALLFLKKGALFFHSCLRLLCSITKFCYDKIEPDIEHGQRLQFWYVFANSHFTRKDNICHEYKQRLRLWLISFRVAGYSFQSIYE